jgi:hypothetical protein
MLNATLEPRLPEDFAGITNSTIKPGKKGAPGVMEEPPHHRSERNRAGADFADMHTAHVVDGAEVNADVGQQIIRQKLQISEQQLTVISLIAFGVFTLLSAAAAYMNFRLRHVENEPPDAITETAGECAEPKIAEKTAAAI